MTRYLFLSAAIILCAALYLLTERLRLVRKLRKIPLRICVTGTRGKSSVTRLIAACLREAGHSVLAKTTGSLPALLLSDGREQIIERQGNPTILEGKKVIKRASDLKVEALVTELMSIRAECLRAESLQMFSPHILVMTNVRLDHLEQMGKTKEDIARCLAQSIPKNAVIFIPEGESFPIFQSAAKKRNSRLILIPKHTEKDPLLLNGYFPGFEFEDNIRLTYAVTDFLEIDRDKASKGMVKVLPDFGSLKAWSAELGPEQKQWYFVSCFAANDPESTRDALSRIKKSSLLDNRKVIGLLNLRDDRGARTLQWLKSLKNNDFPEFNKLILSGMHAPVLKRRLKSSCNRGIEVLQEKDPEKILARLTQNEKQDTVLVGLGNMGGLGKSMVNHWEKRGKLYDF
jgi:poly-gamma-glutamate synthase PgsB/CapB